MCPDKPGNEIVATAMDGSVYVVWRDRDGWKSERAAKFAGEMIQCAVGDADPTHDGVEIVAVGMVEGREGEGAGAVHLVSRENDAWVTEELFRDTALVHAVCIGELDPTHADGGEVLVAGFSGKATVLARTADGWTATEVATLEGNGKNAVFMAGVAVVGTSAGVLIGIERDAEGWKTEVLDRAPAGQSRLATDGTNILSARDDGVLVMILPDGQREPPPRGPEAARRGAGRPRSGDARAGGRDLRLQRAPHGAALWQGGPVEGSALRGALAAPPPGRRRASRLRRRRRTRVRQPLREAHRRLAALSLSAGRAPRRPS